MRRLRVRKLAAAAFVCLLFATSAHADMLDLTTEGSWGVINGAILQQYSPGPTGTGTIDTFVRIQGPQDSDIQQGYNTDGRPVQYDEVASPQTHSLLLSDLSIVTNGGTPYREFLLDINQDVNPFLSLDKVEIYLETTGDLLGHPDPNFSAPIYDLDAGGDNWVKLDYALNTGTGGSGAGDMLLFVPDSVFTGADNYVEGGNNYIYLYSRLGDNFSARDGFEEWAYGVDGPIIPEPATVLLLGLGALALLRRRRA